MQIEGTGAALAARALVRIRLQIYRTAILWMLGIMFRGIISASAQGQRPLNTGIIRAVLAMGHASLRQYPLPPIQSNTQQAEIIMIQLQIHKLQQATATQAAILAPATGTGREQAMSVTVLVHATQMTDWRQILIAML